MKNKISHKKVAFATALVASMAYACSAFAQGAGDNQEQKLQLMIAAVDARDKGDLEISKKNLEGLLKISPDERGFARAQKSGDEIDLIHTCRRSWRYRSCAARGRRKRWPDIRSRSPA